MTTKINPKALGVEQNWFPFTDERRAELRRQLLDSGCPRSQTAGILAFVEAQAEGDVTAFPISQTRARYRRTLAELAGIDPDGDQRRGLPLGYRAQVGATNLRALALVGGGALLLAAAPITTEPDGYVEFDLLEAA